MVVIISKIVEKTSPVLAYLSNLKNIPHAIKTIIIKNVPILFVISGFPPMLEKKDTFKTVGKLSTEVLKTVFE